MKHFILITAIAAASLLGLYFLADTDYTSGPFPNELPAGHRIVTNGEKFCYEHRLARGTGWRRTSGYEFDTPCEVIQFAWGVREELRKTRHVWSVVPAPKSGDWCEVKK